MFKCVDCEFVGGLDEYCQHITKLHPKNAFICGQFGCSRQYFGIKSLKKHLKLHCHNSENENLIEAAPTINDNLSSGSTIENLPISFESQSDHFNKPIEKDLSASIDDIEKTFRLFILSLYSDPSLDRKRASHISSYTSTIIVNLLNHVKVSVEPLISDNSKNEFSALFSKTTRKFTVLKTEKNVIADLRRKDCYRDPIMFTIDEDVADTVQRREITLNVKKSTAARLNITFIFKKFFELPHIFAACKSYMDKLESESSSDISNIIQGSSWKTRKRSFGDKIVIPFCLYHDDFEPGNTLGANGGVQSLSSFFVHFPTLPAHISTSLENIFPILSCKTSQKKYGLDKVLQHTITELKNLETEGISLEINNESTRVYFSLCAVLGDNKALNELMGITQCFKKSGFCRVCSCTSDESKTMVTEDQSKLRTPENYAADLAKKDFKRTGIKEECILNQLPSFNVINCPSVDIMHDLFEGVCHFQLSKIILHFIAQNFFTLDDLNNRKSLFDYGTYEIDNKSVDIKLTHLKNGKLKMSASETLCFTQHFSLMIGDMVQICTDCADFGNTGAKFLKPK